MSTEIIVVHETKNCKVYATSESCILKVAFKSLFKRKLSHAAYTLVQVFTFKSNFMNRMSSISQSFHSHMMSCDWPARNI